MWDRLSEEEPAQFEGQAQLLIQMRLLDATTDMEHLGSVIRRENTRKPEGQFETSQLVIVAIGVLAVVDVDGLQAVYGSRPCVGEYNTP